MKKLIALIAVVAAVTTLSGCSSMPEKTCTALYRSGDGGTYEVSIFGTQIQGDRLLLRAGYPFSFHYISEDHFVSHNCSG